MHEKEIDKLEDYLNSDFPEILYHYTNLEGLQGILQSSNLWFGNLYFLNDSSEYNLGLELIINQLETYKAGFSILPSTKYFVQGLESALIYLKDKQPPYILSLTENSDLLSQWRGYTNNGIGVNLGIESEKLTAKNLKIYKCIYDSQIQKEIVEKIVSDSIFMFIAIADSQGIFKGSDENTDLKIFDEAVTIAGNHFMQAATLFCSLLKDHSFHEEDEWRALLYNDEEPFFLTSTKFFKPYKIVHFENFDSIVKELNIGPNPEKSLCKLSIEMLCKKHKINFTKINQSTIPYRN